MKVIPLAVTDSHAQSTRNNATLVRCSSYNPIEVRRALRRSFDLLGSPERFIRPGDRVLLKPNMLSAKEPERSVTTYPEIITAVGEIVLDCRGKVILGDSPAGSAKDLQKYWDITGISQAAHRLGVQPVSFEETGVKSFTAPGGFVSITRLAFEVDGIINLPKLKTHMLTRMTGAVKNMFGVVPGFRKSYLHSVAPTALPFSRFIVEVYRQTVPNLNIMDAVMTMEGNGPSSGNPRYLGGLLVSEDALAIDSVAARILGMEERNLPIFQAAVEAGLWNPNRDGVSILGEDPSEFILSDFEQPDISKLERIPKFVQRRLKNLIWIRPKAVLKKCTSCGICVENCPQGAMEIKKEIPWIDYSLCIKCGCCDEICPENAITQEMSLLAKILS